jgi:hypothetical protein
MRGEIGTAETVVGGVAAAVAVGCADDIADGWYRRRGGIDFGGGGEEGMGEES